MDINEGKWDVILMETPLYVNIFNDDEGVLGGIATHIVNQKRAAKFLEISIPTLRKYVRLGFINRYKHGRRVYYLIEELEKAKRNIF